MAIVVPEAAEAVTEGSAAIEGGAARHARKRARPAAAARNRAAAQPRGRVPLPDTIQPRAQRGPQRSSEPRSRSQRAAREYGRQARSVGSSARLTPGDRNYQAVILAEYVTATVIVAISPLARGGSATGGASPYAVGDLKQLVAIAALYFVLALASGGNRGRYTAWIGGLILLAILIRESSDGALNGLFTVLGSTKNTGAAADATGSTGSTGSTDTGSASDAGTSTTPDATGIFPTIQPGGTVVPATPNLIDGASG